MTALIRRSPVRTLTMPFPRRSSLLEEVETDFNCMSKNLFVRPMIDLSKNGNRLG